MKTRERKTGAPRSRSARPEKPAEESPRPEHIDAMVLLVLSSDEGFASVIREMATSNGLESRIVPLAGFGPGEVARKKSAAVVDCRSYFGVAQKVVRRLHEMRPGLPVLAIVGKGSNETDQKDRLYGSGATICISENGGPEALREGIHLLIRTNQATQRITNLEDVLRERNFELSSMRREMGASQIQHAKRVREQITVYRAARAMLSVFDFDDLANEIVRLATTELGAEVGSLMLIEGEDLVVRALYGHIPGEDPILGRRQKVGEGVSGWVAREGKPLLIEDIEEHAQFKERGGARYRTKSAISCPMIMRGRIRGVINVNNKIDGGHFTEDDLRLIRTLAITAAGALDNFELVEQNRRSETMSSIGELATRMAHEIRNPLHAIKMNIQILGKKFPMSDDDKEYYDILLGEINRLENLVKDVLSFAKQDKLNLVSCDLSNVTEHTMAVLRNLLEEKGIELKMDLARDLPIAHADEAKIEQVIMNIVVNAIEAMKDGGTLYVSTGVITPFVYPRSHYGEEIHDSRLDDHQYAEIIIRDTGSGIERKHIDKIFHPFFTTKIDGTGLGLSTTRNIIEAHGGKILFESEAEVGTTFKIELPIAEDFSKDADTPDDA